MVISQNAQISKEKLQNWESQSTKKQVARYGRFFLRDARQKSAQISHPEKTATNIIKYHDVFFKHWDFLQGVILPFSLGKRVLVSLFTFIFKFLKFWIFVTFFYMWSLHKICSNVEKSHFHLPSVKASSVSLLILNSSWTELCQFFLTSH